MLVEGDGQVASHQTSHRFEAGTLRVTALLPGPQDTGLFDLLGEQYDRVIVLDDVSEIFAQRIALQILLAALGNQPDETGERVVKYRRRNSEETIHFSGGIIMISNLEIASGPVLQALKSRVHYLCYQPTDQQIAAMMRNIAANGWPAGNPQLSPDECLEVAEFLIAESQRHNCQLDLRMLVDKAFPDFLQHRNGNAETHWKDLILTTLREHVTDLAHTPQPKPSQKDEIEQERQLVLELFETYDKPEDQIMAWHAKTGKTYRSYYRRKKELGL